MQEIGNIIISYREAEASLNNFHTLMTKAPELKPEIRKHLETLKSLNLLM